MSRTLTGPHFITTVPTLTVCAGCRRTLLTATVSGLDRRIDTDPLTETGELAALLAGRVTYHLRGHLLTRRRPEHIRGGRNLPVLADHRCTPTDASHLERSRQPPVAALIATLAGWEQPTDPDQPPPF